MPGLRPSEVEEFLGDFFDEGPEPACENCGCTEQSACTMVSRTADGSRSVVHSCGWFAPGLCTFCAAEAAYVLYMEATGRVPSDPEYLCRGKRTAPPPVIIPDFD